MELPPTKQARHCTEWTLNRSVCIPTNLDDENAIWQVFQTWLHEKKHSLPTAADVHVPRAFPFAGAEMFEHVVVVDVEDELDDELLLPVQVGADGGFHRPVGWHVTEGGPVLV